MNVARVELFPKDEFIATALIASNDVIVRDIYVKDVFYNYETGFLQNYFQKINDQIEKEEEYWMYETDYTDALAKLKNETLYIPTYHRIKYNPRKGKDNENTDEAIDKIYSNYDYKYEFQDDEILNERILSGEEFYYLRYARVNSQKFIHIVNAKSGEIIYRHYSPGFSYNIKPKHLKELNSKIKKASK